MTASPTLLLLRHAHVVGHRGDVAITDEGREQATRAGAWLGARAYDIAAVMYGGTRRTRETADGIAAGLPHGRGLEAADAFALRNPDLYLGGDRVSMVSSAEAFAEQTRAMRPEGVTRVAFFREWMSHPDRIGFWLTHDAPPGDDSRSVARRISAFAASLNDVPDWHGRTIVAVTHSPVLRSVGLHLRGVDPGEPPYVTGYAVTTRQGALDVVEMAPAT